GGTARASGGAVVLGRCERSRRDKRRRVRDLWPHTGRGLHRGARRMAERAYPRGSLPDACLADALLGRARAQARGERPFEPHAAGHAGAPLALVSAGGPRGGLLGRRPHKARRGGPFTSPSSTALVRTLEGSGGSAVDALDRARPRGGPRPA